MDRREWRKTDTMPQPGKVGAVCQKWVLHEDEALAYRLQNEEIKTHYHGNRSRNALIRQDLPQAKQEQIKEEEEAEQLRAMYRDMLRRQEQRDAELAAKLQQQVAVGRAASPEDPLPPPPPLSPHDDVHLYRREPAATGRVDDSVEYDDDDPESVLGAVGGGSAYYYPPPSPIRESDFPFLAPSRQPRPQQPQYFSSQPQPLPPRRYPPPPPAQPQASSDVKRKPIVLSSDEDLRDLGDRDVDEPDEDDGEEGAQAAAAPLAMRFPSPRDVYEDDEEDDDRYVTGHPRFDFLSEEEEEEARRRQELEDQELAKRLQEEEIRDMSPVEILERDRVIAMEAQDREYARLLYEKEKARARRAARERRARKEAQQQGQPKSSARGERSSRGTSNDAYVEDGEERRSRASDRRHSTNDLMDPDRIEVMTDEEPDENRRQDPNHSQHGSGERAVDVGSLDKREAGASKDRRQKSYSADEEEFIGTSPICPQPLALSTSPAPPYMPIQGQRRLQAFEKKSKKKDKGCAQQ